MEGSGQRRAESVGYWAHRIAGRLHQQMARKLEEIGLAGAEGFLISYLHNEGPSSVAEIARRTRHSHPSVIRVVDQLEEKGLVHRVPHEHDRRIKIVQLTERGEELHPVVEEYMREVHERVEACMGSGRYRQLIELLRGLDESLGSEEDLL